MDKITHYCGIDVSKDTIDVQSDQLGHKVYENNLNGFRKLLKASAPTTHSLNE